MPRTPPVGARFLFSPGENRVLKRRPPDGIGSEGSPCLAAVVLFACLLVSGCAGVTHEVCREGGVAASADLLFFGADKPGGSVTDSEWRQFLGEIVTPRFPEGFTWWAAEGQWRETGGGITHEGSRVLQIVHSGGRGRDREIREIIQVYKERFQQKAVLHVRSPACMAL